MTFILPPHLTSDAVPEKRTADEENQPPSAQQAQESVGRQDDAVIGSTACDQNNERGHCSNLNKPAKSTEDTQEGKADSGSKKKSKKSDGKKKRSSNSTNIVNITQCSGFQVCSSSNVSNYWNINGGSSMFHKSNSPHLNDMQNTHSHSHQRPTLPIPEKVFRCLEKVSEEDCTIVSEYVACEWRTLGELLFSHNMSQLKDYISPIEGKSKKEAVRLLLIRWKQVNCKVADVRQLCLVLQKLNETEALIKLAGRHGIQ